MRKMTPTKPANREYAPCDFLGNFYNPGDTQETE